MQLYIYFALNMHLYGFIQRRMKQRVKPVRGITSGFRHNRASNLDTARASVLLSVDFLSRTVLLPGRQRDHDYNAIQRIDAESWGHTRGHRRVVNPRRVRPERSIRRNLSSFDPDSHPLSWDSLYTTCANSVVVSELSDLHKVVNESPRYL